MNPRRSAATVFRRREELFPRAMEGTTAPDLETLEAAVRRDYAGPGRHYHDVAHLDDCLAQLSRVEGLAEDDRRRLRLALLWHDVIYDPRRRDNEEASAERARQELAAAGIAAAEVEEVVRLILLTKGHRVAEGDRRGALLVSIDLSILGAEAERYRAYADAIRLEYAHVPEAAYRAGRAAILRSLLDADPLYPDPAFRDRLEETARRNLALELAELTGPI
jgi:predicted metal-dependent HD superfamily phosphohydrolase